jgi:hypothetical protein
MRKRFTDMERKRIAHAQQWRCAGTCGHLLPPTFEIDHIVSLADGGDNAETNLQSLCPNCHATKTADWWIAHSKQKHLITYDNRWDVYLNQTTLQCTMCKQIRCIDAPPHAMCFAIEAPHLQRAKLQCVLAKFAFIPRARP